MAKKKDKGKKNSDWLTKGVTRKRFKKELRAATRSRFRPLKRELKSQERISKKHAANTSDYYQRYEDTLNRLRQQSAAATQGALGAMNQYAQAAGDGSQGAIQQANTQSAAVRGAPVPTAGANLAAATGANRIQQGSQVAGALAGQGANQFAYLGGRAANAQLGRIEALGDIHSQRRGIRDDMEELGREKADFKDEFLREYREGERRYDLARRELRQARKESQRNRRFEGRQAAKDRAAAKQASSGDSSAPSSGGGSQGGGGVSKGDLRRAMSYIRQAEPGEDYTNRKSAIDYLVNRGVDPKVAKAAVAKAEKKAKGGGKKGGKGKGGGSWLDDLPW